MSNTAANYYQSPGVTNIIEDGPNSTKGFFRPNNSQMAVGPQLNNFLTGNGTLDPNSITNRTVKYDGGLTREMLGNTTGFLSNQIGNSFNSQLTGIEDLFNQYGSLGGLGGVAASGTNSAVYRPGGVAAAGTPAAAANGTQTSAFGATNPFNATF